MTSSFQIMPARQEEKQLIIALLQAEKLPTEDLPVLLDGFFIARDNDEVIGAVGLERYDNYGLLRSLVVNRVHRNRNIAAALLQETENKAAVQGIETIYLLTETAPDYFGKKGYEKIEREDVPAAVQRSSEFSHVCPVSAIVMKKRVK
jgi:amino-acid N-acetyltransferase